MSSTASAHGGFLGTILIALYRAFGRVITPALSLVFARRAQRGKEDPSRRQERFGVASVSRPGGPLIWVHAASVGEMNAADRLIGELGARGGHVLLTTGTLTSARIAEARALERVIHQFVPYDTPANMARFLDHWRPDLAVTIESEIWPTTIVETKRRDIPFIVVSATLSARSARGWQRLSAFARALFGRIDLVLAQTSEDADRLIGVGAHTVEITGNLKFDGMPLVAAPELLEPLKTATGDRPVWLAASTHTGEDEIIVNVHNAIADAFPNLLTIIAPRHPERGPEIAQLLESKQMSFAQRSANALPDPSTQIYLADTIGEMGILLRCTDIAFVGKSLVPEGGQNPLEAIRLQSAVITGPHTFNLTDLYAPLIADDAVWVASSQSDLAEAVGTLLGDGRERNARIAKANAVVDRSSGALTKTLQALAPYLPGSLRESVPPSTDTHP